MERAIECLRFVQLDPERVLRSYPHQLSGGMRQRVMIGLGLLLRPRVLILDEPTTALDVLTQRSIIEVLRRLKPELHFSMIFVSHDLSLAAELADRVATMYAGRIVEIGQLSTICSTTRAIRIPSACCARRPRCSRRTRRTCLDPRLAAGLDRLADWL